MNIDKKALKGVVDEIEASRARQRGETEFQREALKRAVKNHQLDAKAIRIVLQRRAMGDTKRDEQDYYVHSYELALGGKKDALDALEQGASIRQAAKAGGISTGAAAALAKGVQESSFVNTETAPDVPGEGAAIGPEIGSGSLATTNGQETTNGGEAEGHDGAGQEASLRRQPDSQDAGGGPGRTGEAGNGRDDRREDGGGLRGVGAPQDQLATNGQEREESDEHEGLGAPRAGDREHSGDAGRQEKKQHEPMEGRSPGGLEGAAGAGSETDSRAEYQRHLNNFRRTPDSVYEAAERAKPGAVAEPSAAQRVARPNDDGLEIPPFLRRQASR